MEHRYPGPSRRPDRGNGPRPQQKAEQISEKPLPPGCWRLFLPCAIGLEKALGNEIRHLGLEILETGHGRYEVAATPEQALRALRCLRTAERVFVVLANFRAFTFEDLFQGVLAIDWPAWIKRESRIHIDKVRVHESALTSFASIQSITQKAAYQKLCDAYRVRTMPETGLEHVVRLYLDHNKVRVCLDLSGEALHRRGYRAQSGEAPIKESVAAAMVILSGWRRRMPFHDPFCGSGTIAAEALMFAHDISPNINRTLGFEGLGTYPAVADRELKKELLARIDPARQVIIRASDRDRRMVDLCAQNIRGMLYALGMNEDLTETLASCVKVEHLQMENVKHREDGGAFVCNPPYGERLLDPSQAVAIYERMGRLNDEFPDWSLSVITPYPELDHVLNRRAEWIRDVHNGNSEAKLYHFAKIDR